MTHHHHDHDHGHKRPGVSRRAFLRRSSEITLAAALTVTSGGALLNSAEAWAMEPGGLKPDTMRTLVIVARDIYPHDRLPDRFYAIAVKPYGEKALKDPGYGQMIEAGIAALDTAAGKGGYAGLGWEQQRVGLLRAVEATEWFQAVRSGLVVNLYNQQELWPVFGYEGESYSKGGYIHRGFDDIDWL